MNQEALTIPWDYSEYIFIDGFPYCYSVSNRGNIEVVHFPGGVSFRLDTLKAQGRNIRMPDRVRSYRYA